MHGLEANIVVMEISWCFRVTDSCTGTNHERWLNSRKAKIFYTGKWIKKKKFHRSPVEKSKHSEDFNLRPAYFSEYFLFILSHNNISQHTQKFSRTSANGCMNGCWHQHLEYMRTMLSEKQTLLMIGILRKRDVAYSSTWSHMIERTTKIVHFQSIKSVRFLWQQTSL